MFKTILIAFITIFIFTTNLPAQIGVKGGPVISDIVFAEEGQIPYLGFDTNSLIHKLPHFTYQIGLFTEYRLSKNLNVQPEFLFSKKGLNYNSDFIYDDIKYHLNIYYLEIPILLKYDIVILTNGLY